jgi:hypothetical protein
MVSLVDVMHRIEEASFPCLWYQGRYFNRVVPLLIIGMQLVDVTCLGLEPVVHITDKEYPTREELQVWISSQLGFELSVHSIPVRAPVGPILITYRTFLPKLVADGDIKYWSTGPISMGELSLQPLDVIGKSWTDQWHINHLAQQYVKSRNLLRQ